MNVTILTQFFYPHLFILRPTKPINLSLKCFLLPLQQKKIQFLLLENLFLMIMMMSLAVLVLGDEVSKCELKRYVRKFELVILNKWSFKIVIK